MASEQPDDWNPLDTNVLNDQRAAYDAMRERCPVARSKFMGWSLFRHADIVAVLADSATFINASRFPAIPNGMNPPVHGPYNSALATFFDKTHMVELEPYARQLAKRLIAPLCTQNEVEFVGAFIKPYLLTTLCKLMGWPEQQWQSLADWIHGNEQVAINGDAVAGKEWAERFAEQVKTNLDLHRSAKSVVADATDQLLLTEVNGQRFSDDEIVSLLRNWVAGHGTTIDALSIVIVHIAQDPELQVKLRKNPALIPAAIEEILRVDGPLVANRRTTSREVEIQGHKIPKDASLSLMWIAANRDPLAFKDPDSVNLDRNTNDGLVWGQGIHLCLGAPLARLEMCVALEELLARTALFQIAVISEARARKVYPGNGFAALHLTLTWQ